jgi:uncharacterized protein (TIGR00730 family)
MIQSVTVYCSSSDHVAPVHRDAAMALGRAIASEGWSIIYGGGRGGLMGLLADSAHAAGGRVVGITPQMFIDGGHHREGCHEFIVADSMRHRKTILEQRGDAFIALPGGLGTYDELLEVICNKSLGLHGKPIVMVNVEGFFRPLLNLIEHGIEHRFIKPSKRELYFVAEDVGKAMEYLRRGEERRGLRTED